MFISHKNDRRQQPNISDTSCCRGASGKYNVPAVHSRIKNTFFISMQQGIYELGANRSVENWQISWNALHKVLQSVVFQTVNCTAVDCSYGYNHGRKESLSVYCKGSQYSAPTECKHLNTPLLAEFNLLKIASGFTCYNNMEFVQYIDNTNVTTCCEMAGALIFLPVALVLWSFWLNW